MLARLARYTHHTLTAAVSAASASTAPSTSGRCAPLPRCLFAARAPPAPLRRLAAAAASQGSGIEPPDVRKLAQMATIDVTDEEVAAWEPTLQKIAGWFDQLQAVDVEGVPPATDAGVGAASTRPDVVDAAGLADPGAALGQVPEREGGFVRVPKVM